MLVLYAGEQTMKVFSNGCIMGGVSCVMDGGMNAGIICWRTNYEGVF